MPGVGDIPRCTRADIDWYVRMPKDPPLVDPKDEMQLELCKEAGSNLKAMFPEGELASTLSWVCMYTVIRVILCLLARFKMQWG